MRIANGGYTRWESINNLTHNFVFKGTMSANTLFGHAVFLCALVRNSRASVLSRLLVPGVEALQGNLKLVPCSYNALKTGELQSKRQRSILRQPCDQLIDSFGGGGDLLSAAAVFVFS